MIVDQNQLWKCQWSIIKLYYDSILSEFPFMQPQSLILLTTVHWIHDPALTSTLTQNRYMLYCTLKSCPSDTLYTTDISSLSSLHAELCDKLCQCLAASQWFSLGTQNNSCSSTNKTDRHHITEILLKVNTITQPNPSLSLLVLFSFPTSIV